MRLICRTPACFCAPYTAGITPTGSSPAFRTLAPSLQPLVPFRLPERAIILLAMPLRLQYIGQTSLPVEVEGIVPQLLRDKSPADIERMEIFHGNQKLPLAEFFRVTGDPADGNLEFEGALAGVHWIGARMTEGILHVAGDAGRHVGSQMQGGEIHVQGNAGDWLGAEMHGGLIRADGRAGQLVGSAYRGSRQGMTGGTILVGRDAGNEIGHSMRRGLLVVGGSAGDFVGVNMIAGTILVLGNCGMRPGAGMRRGTIGLFGPDPPPLLPTFRRGGCSRPLVLELILRHVRELAFPIADELFQANYWNYHGDFVAAGRGELLVRAAWRSRRADDRTAGHHGERNADANANTESMRRDWRAARDRLRLRNEAGRAG